MRSAPIPDNEIERLEELVGYKILDTPEEEVFNDFTRLAAYICGTPISLISLVDKDRQWFKSKVGLDAKELPRDVSFCPHAILDPNEVMIIPDATQDERFFDNPIVTEDPNIRFYAGVPLVTAEKHALGTLCVIDRRPRELTPEQIEALQILGRQIIQHFEIRRNLANLTLVKEQDSKPQNIQKKERRSFFKKIAIGLGLASTIVLGTTVATYRSILQLINTDRAVTHTLVVLSNIEQLLASITEVETAKRGYVITGQEAFLQPYRRERPRIETEVENLRELTDDNPRQQARIDELEPLVTEKMILVDNIIEARAEEGFDEALELILTDNSLPLMEAINRILDDMEAEENLLLEQRSERAERVARNTLIAVTVGIAIIFALLCAIYYVIYREILQRQEIEGQLQQERNFTSAVIETAEALVIVIDREGRIVRFNRACEQLTGYTFTEVRGRRFWDFLVLAEEEEKIERTLLHITRGRFPNESENAWITKSGEARQIAWTNSALTNELGEVEYIIGTGLDITERKRREKYINAEQAVTAALANSATVGEAMKKLLPNLGNILGWQRCEYWRVDDTRNVLRCCRTWQRDREILLAKDPEGIEEFESVTRQTVFASGYGLPGHALESSEPVWMKNLPKERKFLRFPYASALDLQVGGGIALTAGVEALGALVFFYTQDTKRDAELTTLLSSMGNQIGQFIKRKQAEEEVQRQNQLLQEELSQAAEYVKSLLPLPITRPVKIQQEFVPSLQLGGDAFDYYWLDDNHLVIYLLDVAGHGVQSALLSVSVLNVMRSRSLPNTDFKDPSEVLKQLNNVFQMNESGENYFTIWYGVYNRQNQELIYSSAGHPPAVTIFEDGAQKPSVTQLGQSNIPIGMLPDMEFDEDVYCLHPGNTLYIFSDGIYEIQQKNGQIWGLDAFVEFLSRYQKENHPNLEGLLDHIRTVNANQGLEDDVSILKIIIPD